MVCVLEVFWGLICTFFVVRLIGCAVRGGDAEAMALVSFFFIFLIFCLWPMFLFTVVFMWYGVVVDLG